MSPRTASNRYLRTGLADAYSGLGGAYSILAAAGNVRADQKRQYWEEARSSCQKSLALWNDKQKRGELESNERESAPRVAQCIATSEEHLHNLGATVAIGLLHPKIYNSDLLVSDIAEPLAPNSIFLFIQCRLTTTPNPFRFS
jgi:hypothetical protein